MITTGKLVTLLLATYSENRKFPSAIVNQLNYPAVLGI